METISGLWGLGLPLVVWHLALGRLGQAGSGLEDKRSTEEVWGCWP